MRGSRAALQWPPRGAGRTVRNARFCGMKPFMRPWLMTPGSETKTDEQTDTATVTRLDRPWNVIVLDDPVSLMTYVTQVFMEVFGYPQPRAQRLMLEVHNTGR